MDSGRPSTFPEPLAPPDAAIAIGSDAGEGNTPNPPPSDPSDSSDSSDAGPASECGGRGLPCCAEGARCEAGLFCEATEQRCEPCASFHGLGFGSGRTDSRAFAISADGSTAVGHSRAQGEANRGIVWHLDSAVPALLVNNGVNDRGRWQTLPSTVWGASAEGSIVVGHGTFVSPRPDNQGEVTENAFMLEPPNSEQLMFGGRALGVSANGAVVVGAYGEPSQAFRWTAAETLQNLGTAHALQSSQASAISGNGCCVVGWAEQADGPRRAALWQGAALLDLGVLPNDTSSESTAINPVGDVAIGVSRATNSRAFRWQDATGLVSLEPLEHASGLDAQGTRVVGSAGGEAALWESTTHSVVPLRELLGELLPPGWTLLAATGISADGRRIVGYGQSPNAPVEEAWVATLGPRCSPPSLDAGAFPDGGTAAPSDRDAGPASSTDPRQADGGRQP